MKRASELEYLQWFRENVDFGPAHTDVIDSINREFVKTKKKWIPKEWDYACNNFSASEYENTICENCGMLEKEHNKDE